MEAWISNATGSTSVRDSFIKQTVSDMSFAATTLDPTQSKRNAFRATAICAAVPCERRGAGKAQHLADNVGGVDVPGRTSITPFSADWLAVEINMSAINACVGALQCNGTYSKVDSISIELFLKPFLGIQPVQFNQTSQELKILFPTPQSDIVLAVNQSNYKVIDRSYYIYTYMEKHVLESF